MVQRNQSFNQFLRNYLFVEIEDRKINFIKDHPEVKLISLGIGDTTEPIPPYIAEGFQKQVKNLTTVEGYTGYPLYNGSLELRQLIVDTFYSDLHLTPDEIFISDGSKPDLARLQLLFSSNTTVAVQDPVYPAYVDGCVISGKAGNYDAEIQGYKDIVYMQCNPENHFFPDLKSLKKTDLIFFCSPNNPTGVAATKQQLTELVQFAKKNQSIIIYDSAYSSFITKQDCPKSIYEIPGAHEVAFETSSFSKSLGFTGIRLGWTVCPKTLHYSNDEETVHQDWSRIMGTCFNGASNISEKGAIAALSKQGLIEMKTLIDYYMSNARIIKDTLQELKLEYYGGVDSPYIWMRIPEYDSWMLFQYLLENANVIVTPGAGFGKEGKYFIRISSFAHQSDVKIAVQRLKKAFLKFKK